MFEKQCATCHQIDGVGAQVAPDISDSREKSAEQLLTDIIQPNRAIDSNYFSYTALTVDGLVHTGLLATETSTSVTLKQAEGKAITLLRDVYELPHEDIAAELGISETAAKVRLHRARRQLKEHLFPRREGTEPGATIRAS